MALKSTDQKDRQGLKGFTNKHFGKNEEGEGFTKQVLKGVGDAYTLNSFTKMKGRDKRDTTIVVVLGGVISSFWIAGAAVTGGVAHSNFYDGSLEASDTYHMGELESVSDDKGYLAVTTPDHGMYLVSYEEGAGYALYEGYQEKSGDITFTQLDAHDAVRHSLQISNAYEEQRYMIQHLGGSEDVNETAILDIGQLSAPYQIEGETIYLSADEPVRIDISQEYNDWDLADLEQVFANAADNIAQNGTADLSVEPLTHENELRAPMDRGGLLTFMALAMGAVGGYGLGSGGLSANRRSRERYNKTNKMKP